MKNYFSLLIVLFIVPMISTAQESRMIRCGTMERLEELKQKDPDITVKRQELEEKIQRIITQNGFEKGGEASVTIPVVFHIIHNGDAVGSGENIAITYINAQMDQLNDDFRRMNSDAGNTPTEFQDEAADTGIEFCLAQTDPSGNATSGIQRIHINTLSGVSMSDCWTSAYIDANIKTPTVWDSDRYLNIWVTAKIERNVGGSCSNDILGYAQFPGGSANTDGVVLLFSTLGSIATPFPGASPYDLGRTATHEVGHWLNLIHIWGDDGTACSGTDQVADTPNQGGATIGCPSHPQTSCSSHDMFMNYMDYSDDDCFNMFTLGQANRMQAAITASRPDLDPTLCQLPCPDHLTLTPSVPGTLSGTAEFEANLTITATNTVASGASVDYHAGQMVLLQANFVAASGTDFHAFIQGCTSFTSEDDVVFRNQSGEENPAETVGFNQIMLNVFPNPSGKGDLTIEVGLDLESTVSIYLFNPTGQLMGSLLKDQVLDKGDHRFIYSAQNLAAGIYYLRLIQGNQMVTKKVIILD